MLNFIIPVRHHRSVPDWGLVQSLMSTTFGSVAAQDDPRWRAVVVANRGADLPQLPQNFEVVRVDFSLKPIPALSGGREKLFNAIRDDKGARIWAGIQAAKPEGHVMVVDYDDFVSRRLAGLAASKPETPGWYVAHGYKFDGSAFLERCPNFADVCGTSLIVRADLFQRRGDNQSQHDFIRYSVGSHKFLPKMLLEAGQPLAPISYPAAVYRVGHAQSSVSSQSGTANLRPLSVLQHPRRALRTLSRIVRLSDDHRQEFFAGSDPK